MQYCEENVDIPFIKAWLKKKQVNIGGCYFQQVQGVETLIIIVFVRSKNRKEVWSFSSIDSL